MQTRSQLPLDRRSVAWRVNAEPVVLGGGGRALLLQVAHPKVAAGVEQHSSYASDPWGRLFRTIDVMAKLAFGTPEVSARQAELLERLHRRVVGTGDDGEPYDAMDPDLLLWVWATLVDTALTVYERVLPPLSAADRERYYEESKPVAHACGVPEGHCPQDWSGFRAYLQRVIAEELRVTPSARAVAHAIRIPPLPRPFGPLSAWPHQLVTAGLLPADLREAFGFDWDGAHEARLSRFFTVVRAGTRVVPRPVRELGFRHIVERRRPLRVGWLQRRGAELTEARMRDLDNAAP